MPKIVFNQLDIIDLFVFPVGAVDKNMVQRLKLTFSRTMYLPWHLTLFLDLGCLNITPIANARKPVTLPGFNSVSFHVVRRNSGRSLRFFLKTGERPRFLWTSTRAPIARRASAIFLFPSARSRKNVGGSSCFELELRSDSVFDFEPASAIVVR
jgi:hypothetical protein